MLAHWELFADNPLAPNRSDEVRCEGLRYISMRTRLWYGKVASLQVRWRGLYGERVPINGTSLGS